MTSAAPHMEYMWRGLPEEILVSNVLPRLPMASLCRFQAVCKKWNALLTQSDFAARHALVGAPAEEVVLITLAEEFVLITLRLMQPANSLRCWNVLDVANSRVFIPGHRRKIMAADGGLLFVWYGNSWDHSYIVCNPILKAVKVIPWLLRESIFYYNCVVMSTGTVSMEYEILVIHPMDAHYQINCMDVFESQTGRWRRLVNTSVPSPGRWCGLSKFVKFKNNMYRLYLNVANEKPYLIEFDKTTGVGSKLNFPELFLGDRDCMSAYIFELVVSLGRLFCVYRPQRKYKNHQLLGGF